MGGIGIQLINMKHIHYILKFPKYGDTIKYLLCFIDILKDIGGII